MHLPTIVSGVRDHNIRIGREAVGSTGRGIRLMNNFHPIVQLRSTARLRKRRRIREWPSNLQRFFLCARLNETRYFPSKC